MTTDELTRAGLSDDRIRRLVRRGVLQPAGRGAYARADLAADAAGAATVPATAAPASAAAPAGHHRA